MLTNNQAAALFLHLNPFLMTGTAPSAAAVAATDTQAVPMEQDKPAKQQPVREPERPAQPRMSQRGDTLLMPWIDHKGGLNAQLWRQLVQRVVSLVACMPGNAYWPTLYLSPFGGHPADYDQHIEPWEPCFSVQWSWLSGVCLEVLRSIKPHTGADLHQI